MDTTKQENPQAEWMINRRFPTYGDLLAMFGIFIAVQIVVTLIGSIALLFTGQGIIDLEPFSKGRFLALTSLVALTLTALLIWWYRRLRRAQTIHIGLGYKGMKPLLIGWCFLLMLAASIVLEPLYELMPTPNQDFGRGWWSFLAVVVIAPCFEEWICRGQIYGSLRTRYGVARSMVLSALVFGLMHVQPVPVVNAFVLGLVLAFIYHVCNTLWAPIILHALNNAIAYFMTLAGYGDQTFRSLFGESQTGYLIFYAAALVLCVGSLIRIWRLLQAEQSRSTTSVESPQNASEEQKNSSEKQ